MAKVQAGEKAWREAWVGAEYAGYVVIAADPGSGEDVLMIQCQEVVAKFGEDACIIDDGRTVGICEQDHVAFSVVRRPGRAPLAVNVYRLAAKRRRVERPMGGKGKGATTIPTELPAALSGELPGVIRNQSMMTGDYFIACPEVFAVYKKDPKIPVQDMPTGVGVGDTITFTMEAPASERASPIATNIQRKAGEAAEEIYAKTYPWKGGKGKFGKGGKGAKGAKFAPAPGSWRPETTMRMVGMVKHKSPSTGRHFVLCQDISDVYGKDAQIPVEEVPDGGLKVGDRIAFDVSEPRNGQQGIPFARHVCVVGAAGSKRKLAAGDGEDEGDGEVVEEKEDEEEEEPKSEEEQEVGLDGEELQDADEEARMQAEAGDEAEEAAEEALPDEEEEGAEAEDAGEPQRRFALTWAEASKAGKTGTVRPSATLKEPETPEEWALEQDTLFAGMPELKRGWIRIKSKSKSLVYFYNMETGESRTVEPLRWA